MWNAWSSDVLFGEIIGRLLASVVTSGLWLGISLALLLLFRVRNPNVRFMFFFIPLAKGLTMLMRHPPRIEPFRGVLMFSVQLPNPGDLLPSFPDYYRSPIPKSYEATSSLLFTAVLVIGALTAGFFLWRLLGFIGFQRLIAKAPSLDRIAHPSLYAALDRLTTAVGVPKPKLIRVDSREAPFTVGFTRPVIALSTVMLERLSAEEAEAVLAHEIAHIARRDHLFHWVVVIMRDVLFFNPFTYLICSRLAYEKERACDDYGSELSQPLGLAKSLVKLEELRKVAPLLRVTRTFAQSLSFQHESWLAARVSQLLEPKPYRRLTPSRYVGLTLLGIFLFYLEVHVVLLVNSAPLVLS